MKPLPHYSCVAGVLAHLLIHTCHAGAGLHRGWGAVHAVGAGLMAFVCLMVLLMIKKGTLWHEWEAEE